MKQDPEFWKNYDENFETFRLGVMLKQARKEAGLTQNRLPANSKQPNQ
jgi:hypothetical protein